MSTAIRVEGLGKRYTLRHESGESYTALRDLIADRVRGAGRRLLGGGRGRPAGEKEEFWALSDVSFDVAQGDRVGIVGRNGAGKSTLLKILSRITEPSRGQVKIKGRVASLLEVGTGFHPELTGRENIFLNGAILGMGRREIQRKFDEIVEFAEVARFLDTPVKRYSSGMYVRLAFAVAAHLEPEILVVDEVLAVGDAQFQQKCLGKMEDVSSKEGRTVLFVSHNMTTIQHLCSSCVLLDGGRVQAVGSTGRVIDAYLNSGPAPAGRLELSGRKDRKGSGDSRFRSVWYSNGLGGEVAAFRSGAAACFHLEIVNDRGTAQKNVVVALGIDNNMGQRIALVSNEVCGHPLEMEPGPGTVSIALPKLPFTPGRYSFTLFLSANGVVADWIQQAGVFFVEENDYYGTGKSSQGDGILLLDYSYRMEGGTP